VTRCSRTYPCADVEKRSQAVKEPGRFGSCPLDVQDEALEADVERDRWGPTGGEIEQTLESVYREHGARLWRSVLLASGSREVADDAISEAFAQALRRGGALRDPAAWVWRAAFRIAAGELKERGRMTTSEVEPVMGMPEPFVDLWRALAQLPLKQRASIVLADYAGWSHREIAGALGSSASAIGVHVHRARKRLRGLLEDEDD
jgi:DNA-directed RNA polymerase specialized sigma24 family protein